MSIHALHDDHGRTVRYLRLSLTDRCNLRCLYCHSNARHQCIPHEKVLRYEEMIRLVQIVRGMGVGKVRLTGGEPFARKGCDDFLLRLRQRFDDLDIRITTNGTLRLLGLKTEAEDSQRADYENEIFNQIVEESEIIKYPEEQVQAEMDKLDEQYKNLASQNGMEWEDVLENSLKLTQEEYEKELRVYGELMTKYKLVTYALAKAEKIEFPLDEYNEILTNMMTYFGTETVEDFESQYSMSPQEYGETMYNSYGLCMSLTLQKTMDAVYEKLDKE